MYLAKFFIQVGLLVAGLEINSGEDRAEDCAEAPADPLLSMVQTETAHPTTYNVHAQPVVAGQPLVPGQPMAVAQAVPITPGMPMAQPMAQPVATPSRFSGMF